MKYLQSFLLLIALTTISFLVACGGGSSSQPPPAQQPPPPLADGNYVFSLAGQNVNTFGRYYVAGVLKISGGKISSGEQDFVNLNNFNVLSLHGNITGGTVAATADHNLQITVETDNGIVGVGGVETLNGTMVSKTGSRALITEFDASATSSGELDLQTATAVGPGGYAFLLTGDDPGGAPLGIGGVVNVDGLGTISGSGSVFDINDAGNVFQNQPIDPSTVSAPDAFGRIQINLVLTTSGVGEIGLAGYIVGNNRIRLVENEDVPRNVFAGVTGGTAFAQGGKTGTFSAASIAGSSFVVGTTGEDPNGFFQLACVVTANADLTTVNGTLNFNDLTGGAVQLPVAFSGTYTVDPTGRVTVQDTTDGFTIQMYLDGNGNGAVASMDSLDFLAGQAYLQTGAGSFGAGSFSGNYGIGATGTAFIGVTERELDAVGPVKADGVGSLTGTVDQNSLLIVPTAGVTLTGDFVADPSGVFVTTDGIKGLDVLTPANQGAFTYYLIDNQRAVAIETGPNQLTLGYFELVH